MVSECGPRNGNDTAHLGASTNLKTAAAEQGVDQACDSIVEIPPSSNPPLHNHETEYGDCGNDNAGDGTVENGLAVWVGELRIDNLAIFKDDGEEAFVRRVQGVEAQGDSSDAEKGYDIGIDDSKPGPDARVLV